MLATSTVKGWATKMKPMLSNTGYFLKEALTTLRLDLTSNIFSILSMALIFALLTMVIAGWWISGGVVDAIAEEAEINVYFAEDQSEGFISSLIAEIDDLHGVRDVQLIDKDEAFLRMEAILGKEARVLQTFDHNPFSAFIEVRIHLEEIDSVVQQVEKMPSITHVRDNRDILERLQDISRILSILGLVVVVAVAIATLVITSHIIRQGIYNNREHINTLRLLGAPEAFIAMPFILVGLLLTLTGGVLAAALSRVALGQIYSQITGPLPFVPLPPLADLTSSLVFIVISLSTGLGLLGSLYGLRSAKGR